MAMILGGSALVLMTAAVARYAAQVRQGTVPKVARELGSALLVGTLLGLVGMALALQAAPRSISDLLLCAAALLPAPAMLLVHAHRRVPTDGLRLRVGDPLPPFTALTPDGDTFDSRALLGQRTLLKFFRGQWCPFCQAELIRFEALRPELDRLGVQLVALSKDSPEHARAHLLRDGLGFQLLCDPDLKVIAQFGLLHRKALEVSGGLRIKLFGLHVGTRPAYRTMAAPTTLLLDEAGIVRWIDQTADYKVRSSADRVLGEVCRALGGTVLLEAPVVPAVRETARGNEPPNCQPC